MGLWGYTQYSIAADMAASTTVVTRYWNHADETLTKGIKRGSLIALPANLMNAAGRLGLDMGLKSHRQSGIKRGRIGSCLRKLHLHHW